MEHYYFPNSFNNPNNFSESSNSSSMGTINGKTKKVKNGKKISSKEVKLSTDPQSVAARDRRHRISERFKILQSLVPGGTKMDTVSMLEEAIHYVKFLKSQIWWLNQTMLNFDNHVDNSVDHAQRAPFCLPNCSDDQQQTIISDEVYLQDSGQQAVYFDGDDMAQLGFPADLWLQGEGGHFDSW